LHHSGSIYHAIGSSRGEKVEEEYEAEGVKVVVSLEKEGVEGFVRHIQDATRGVATVDVVVE